MRRKNTATPKGASKQPHRPRDSRRPHLRAVDFFCGGGGMSKGFMDAGIEVIAALDNDPDCRATYKANHPESVFLLKDITDYSPKQLKEDLKEQEKPIKRWDKNMVFISCSPCQYWSIINGNIDSARKAKSRDSMGLLGNFKEFVDYFRPGYIVIENVRGIKSHADKSGLDEFMSFIEDKGYVFNVEGLLSVANYKIPQTRTRYVMLASRVGKIKLPNRSKKQKTVNDAFSGLSKLKAGGQDPEDRLHRAAGLSPSNIKRLQLLDEGEGREGWAGINSLVIPAYRGKPTSYFRDNYGRMHGKKPAPTITTRFTSIGCGRFAHPNQDRAISLREGARLQTFPDTYTFETASMQTTARLIGNAVPPEFARRLAMRIRASADKSQKQSLLSSSSKR